MKNFGIAFLVASILLFLSCDGSTETARITLDFNEPQRSLVGSKASLNIQQIFVSVSGDDMSTIGPLEVDMATGTIVLEVPVGENRQFLAQGYDYNRNMTYSGKTISSVYRGLNFVIIQMRSSANLPYGVVARFMMQNSFSDVIVTNNGTNYGLSFLTTLSGGFYTYGFSNSVGLLYATLPNAVVDTTGDFTISTWFYASIFEGERTILARTVNSPDQMYGLDLNTILYLRLTVSNGLQLSLSGMNVTTPAAYTVESTNSWADDQWHHTAAILQGNTLSLYIDGSFVQSTSILLTSRQSDQPISLGLVDYGWESHNPFTDGRIGQTTFWNRALSGSEILSLYNYEKPYYQ